MTNNKQQTAVKLYTQEQLERGMDLANRNVSKKSILESLTPLELPSDDEIREVIKPFQNEMDDFDLGFRNGVQWLRDKIQGGEL
jgi:hypothetical protein